MPPPPRPWIVRPISSVVMFWARAPMRAPAVKKVRAVRRRGLRPRMEERVA